MAMGMRGMNRGFLTEEEKANIADLMAKLGL